VEVAGNFLFCLTKLAFLSDKESGVIFPGLCETGFGSGTKAAPLLDWQKRMCSIVYKVKLHFFQLGHECNM
jgi:hypothetical protein